MLSASHFRSSLFTLSLVLFAATSVCGQGVSIIEKVRTSGTIERIDAGRLQIRNQDGDLIDAKIQNVGQDAIVLDGQRIRLRFPATISVKGQFSEDYLAVGQIVRVQCLVSRTGRTQGEVSEVTIANGDEFKLGIELEREHDREHPFVDATVTGEVVLRRNRLLSIQVPAADGRRAQKVNCQLGEEPVVRVSASDLGQVKAGDNATSVTVCHLSTGDWAIEAIEIELGERAADSASATLDARYRRLSDEPAAPRDVRSEHFLLHTDISDRQAQILLDKLEVMVELIAGYYGKMTPRIIECYVVRDLRQWQDSSLDPSGAAKIANGEGVTMSRSLRGQTRAIVYSCDKHGVVQHEAVHAFCSQTFGSTGPTWYSEGMAEMGQYWRDGQLHVQIDPLVIDYLTNSEPKAMLDIVAAGQITGDSWQAYAWRWALCHLLASNPNYASQFKSLGLAMMRGRSESFETAFGPVAREISFEYDQFVKHFGNGYRADLCAWQWNQRPVTPRLRRTLKADCDARGGWQTTRLRIEEGWQIEYEAEGAWKTSQVSDEVDADGDQSGKGRLMAVILHDYKLSEPFELGKMGTFTAPVSGELYIRCQDAWTELDDNSGTLEVGFERLPSN